MTPKLSTCIKSKRPARRAAPPAVECLEDRCVPAIIHVGPSESIQTIAQAASVAQNGDDIQIDAGTYTGSGIIGSFGQSNLTIEAVGGSVVLDNQDQYISNRKGIFVLDGNNDTVRGITFQNAHDTVGADKNWAGIRGEGNTLTIQDCTFLDNDDGILINNDLNAMTDNNAVTVADSQFGYNGYGDGQSHNMYIGEISSFTLEGSYTHDANQGHLVKSRALNTYLLYNDIVDGPTGGGSSEVDIPYGGNSYLVGNIIEKDATAANHNFLTYDLENSLNAPAPLSYAQQLYIVNNTWVNNYGGGTYVLTNSSALPSSVLLQNNIFAGGGTVASSSYTNITNLVTNSPGFVNWSGGDYHLAAGSPAISAGTQPGSANGFNLTPTSEYAAVASTVARVAANPISIGAYEFASAPTVPNAPSNLAASTVSTTQVNLSWTDNSTTETGFTIDVATDSGFGTIVQTLTAGTGATSTADTGLTAGTPYFYRVRATNSAGSSADSNTASATTLPSAPGNLSASAGTGAITLQWGTVNGASAYDVYRATSPGGEGGTPYLAGVGGTSYTDSNVSVGTTYYYEVTALDAGGQGAASNEASATPQLAPPAAPTGVNALAGNAQVALSWSASSGATSYNLYRATSPGGEGSTPYQSGLTSTSFTDTGLANGTKYYYQVTAVNVGGESGRSSEVSATPQAPATLPSGWSDTDIGSPGVAGSASYSNGTFTVSGGGGDIWNGSDQFNYVSRSFSGGGTVIARVAAQTNTDPWAKAGVMWRNGTAANAMFADVVVTPGNGVAFQWRPTTGGPAYNVQATGVAAPQWVKLVRAGNLFTAFYSANGKTWTQLGGSVVIGMSSSARVGLAVTAHNNSALSTATFTNVSAATGAATQVNLATAYNRLGIASDGSTFSGGLDGSTALSATLLGSRVSWNGQSFALGAANTNNVVSAQGQTITLPQGNYTALTFLADAVYGPLPSLTFTVTYTDGTTQTFTQSFSDWAVPQNYAGESKAATTSHRNVNNGTTQGGSFYVYGYRFALNGSKTVKSITLPNSSNLNILALDLVP